MNYDFWEFLQQLVDTCQIEIDRPMGSTHHRYTDTIYPVNYGYLSGTTTLDGGGIDIWIGSLEKKQIVGVLCTVDLVKKDTELKIVYDCNEDEIAAIQDFVNSDQMQAIFVKRVNN